MTTHSQKNLALQAAAMLLLLSSNPALANTPPSVNAGPDQSVVISQGIGWTPGITYQPITKDEDSEISSGKVYTHAVDFGSNATKALINGVQFQAGGGTFGSIAGTSAIIGTGSTTIVTAHAGNSNANGQLNGASPCAMEKLVQDMNYGASTGLVTLTGLTPGARYQFRLYNRAWDPSAGSRTQNIGFETNGVGTNISGCEYTSIFNEDNASQPNPSFASFAQVYALTFNYTLAPGVTSLNVYINLASGGTYHLYGLTNEMVSNALVNLDGTVSDPEQTPTTLWTKVSGPGLVVFGNPSQVDTSARMDRPGVYVLRLTANDGISQTSDEVTITVNSVAGNMDPVFVSSPITAAAVNEYTPYSYSIAGSATDPDPGAILTYAKVSGPTWLNVAANGALSGTPSSADIGPNSFTVSVTDGIIPNPAEATLNITVNNVNYPPVFASATFSSTDTTAMLPYSASIAGSATDTDADTLVYTKILGRSWLTILPNGTLSGTPAASDVGLNSFRISVSDGVNPPVVGVLNIVVHPAITIAAIASAISTTYDGTGKEIIQAINGSALSSGGNSGNILAETHADGYSSGYYQSATGSFSGSATSNTEVLTFTLSAPSAVNRFILWPFSRAEKNRGLKTCDISFSFDGGASYPNTITAASFGEFPAGPNSGSVSAVIKNFSSQTGVTHIRLTNPTILSSTTNKLAISELRFGNRLTYTVIDTDGDGLTDDYELANTSPASNTALSPTADTDGDGLTNWEEFSLTTNPKIADTDGDGLNDGPELAGAGARPPTSPIAADTDGDGLSDAFETNTGTWTSVTDRGTNPINSDTDADGLTDAVETNTAVYVDSSDTGTSPLMADTDSDGAGDWYEIAASLTSPLQVADKPFTPYPLPDPDASTGVTNKPVKIYIMSGEANMMGYGRASGTGTGTLDALRKENKFPNLFDASGVELARNDVKYRGLLTAIGNNKLKSGFGADTSSFGPELGFGHLMGWYHDAPVLIIKAAQGGRSLGKDFLPPGSEPFEWYDANGVAWVYAGYGDSPEKWQLGDDPIPNSIVTGYQYDTSFMNEAEWPDPNKTPVTNVVDVLDNFAAQYPEYAAQGFEIAGYVWWHGASDAAEPYCDEYGKNMAQFIKQIRTYYETRYPSNTVANAPFVLATHAQGGWSLSGTGATVADQQLSVSGEMGTYPEFAGNVRTMEVRDHYRSSGPSTDIIQYRHHAETFMLVGDALARGMIEMKEGISPPPPPPPSGNLLTSLNQLTNHINGVATLTAQQIADHKRVIDQQKNAMDDNADVIAAAINLVRTYDSVVGPLWVDGTSWGTRNRVVDLDWTMFHVMQYIMDVVYNKENVLAHEALLNGFKFESSAHFPGACAPPSDPNNVHTATINGSFPDTFGRDTLHWSFPARKPTGTYVAPGTIVEVTVPLSLVNAGYLIRVGCHSWDFSGKRKVYRLDRATIVYPISSTTTKIASPYGGGVYIEVPKGASAGVVNIQIKGAVRSPYFSKKPFHMTTLQEWRDVERHHPAPWADFQSEKYMCNVPTNWIYAMDDPVSMMNDWDLACDKINDFMGFDHVRGKESMYDQVDLLLKSNVYSPGYPQANVTYNPLANAGGYANNFLVRGPRNGAPSWQFHEHGHAYKFYRFYDSSDDIGENETDVNMLHVAVYNRAFGLSLEQSFANSRGYPVGYTVDKSAICWMTTFSFSPFEQQMDKWEKSYQLKGHARFVDIIRLFGWEALDNFYRSFNEDEENGIPTPNDKDSYILRASKAANADLRPLFHFWGVFPVNQTTLAANLAAAGVQPSVIVYDHLRYYKTIVPKNNSEFQQWCLHWYGKIPSPDGAWTESEHGRQYDYNEYTTASGKPLVRANGEIFDESASAAVQARVQEIIDLYYPGGTPDPGYATPPSPNPMTFALAPATTPFATVNMTATTATDTQGPVQYYFENITNGNFRDWSTDPYWDNTGLNEGVSYTYRVKARDAIGYETAWSTVASAIPIVDIIPPTITGAGFVDNVGGATKPVHYPIVYTVTFSEDMNGASVSASDFSNSGTAGISITSVSEDSPGVFTVRLSPTEPGSLRLQVNAGALVTDVKGNVLDTTNAIQDDTTITIIPPPVLVSSAGTLAAAVNGLMNPVTGLPWTEGDTYRLAFVSSATMQATSTNLAAYDAFLQGLGDAVMPGPTWKVIASSATENAKTHTSTDPVTNGVGVPILLMDGVTKIADNHADLWDSSIDALFNRTELGTLYTGDVATGTLPAGTKATRPLGGTPTVEVGHNAKLDKGWVENGNTSTTNNHRYYALSDVLTLTAVSPVTLASANIVDDKGGATIRAEIPVTYTVTFSNDMDAATVDAADFSNAGSAPVTIGAVTETQAGVFTVQVTPTAAGTLRLQIPIGASLSDVNALPFDTLRATRDDTILTIIAVNVAPTWLSSPVNEVTAFATISYSAGLSNDVSDANNDPLTFAKVNGPSWLSVATNGTLSGTPGNGNLGNNVFQVSVSDGFASPVETTLNITVNPPQSYTLVYHGNGNTGGGVPIDAGSPYIQGSMVTVLGNSGSLAKAGSAFAGWNTAADGNGTTYAPGATFTINANTTLYAKWNVLPSADAGQNQTVVMGSNTLWTPAALSNERALWLDAADASSITLQAGSRVSQWNDKSGKGRHVTQSTDTKRPLYEATGYDGGNKPSIYFDGGDTLNKSSVTGTTAGKWTLMSVISDQSTDNLDFLFATHGSIEQRFQLGLGGPQYAGASGSATLVTGEQQLTFEAATDARVFRDGATVASGPFTYTDLHCNGNWAVGSRTGSDYMTGKICELIYFEGKLSDSNRQIVEGYLAHKWGLADQMAATHPYKTMSPTAAALGGLDGAITNPESGDVVTSSWSQVSGPAGAIVHFINPAAVDTTAIFTGLGTYVMRLTVNDGFSSTYDEATITVVNSAPANNAPIWTSNPISGANAAANIAYSGTLAGSASDADAGATLTFAKVSGPGWLSVASNGTLSGTPTNGNLGANSFTVSVSDGIATAVQATLNITVVNTFAGWIAGYGVAPGLASFEQDADGDGIGNGAEHFFGTNPGVGSAGLVPASASGNTFTFTHPKNANPAAGVTAAYRWSKDLVTFRGHGQTDGAGTTVNFNAVTNTGVTTVTATVTGTSTSRLFVDVKVNQN